MPLFLILATWLVAFSVAGDNLGYQTILWVGDSVWKKPEQLPVFMERLRELGVTAVSIQAGGDPEPFRQAGFQFYVENMVNTGLCLKYRSKVADWDKFVTDWAKNGRPESALIRDYGLNDPAWLDAASGEMRKLALHHAAAKPLYYDIRDELSVTISANPFDYDFSPRSLAGFRIWLRDRYASLEALNAEWETAFASWDEVKPFTTDRIKNRMASGEANPRGNPDWQAVGRLKFDYTAAVKEPTRWNFAPWADFRSYMDSALAQALASIRAASRAADPVTPVGIEGTQMPSAFGGYDLWKLSQVLDWVEPYDIGNAREIFGSFMPGKPILTTVGEDRTETAQRRLWHLRLLGDSGCILWWSEDLIDFSSAGYPLTTKGKAMQRAIREMTSPEAKQLAGAVRQTDPIAIHYSQASIQADWLLESTIDGSTWLRRFSSHEAAHNRHLRVRNGWLKALQDLGYSPVFLSSEQIESGALTAGGFKALVLPSSLALSDKEAQTIKLFAAQSGNTVFADGWTGAFDEHARLRKAPILSDLLGTSPTEQTVAAYAGGKSKSASIDVASYPSERLKQPSSHPLTQFLAAHLPEIKIPVSTPPGLCLRTHRFQTPSGPLLVFERGVDYQMSEALTQAGGNEPLEKEIRASLRVSGGNKPLDVTVNPWRPTFVVAP